MANNGRDPKSGRFQKGWKRGPGNPHATKVSKLRAELLNTVRPEHMRSVALVLLKKAIEQQGLDAIQLLLDGVHGPIVALDMKERINRLEELLAQATELLAERGPVAR